MERYPYSILFQYNFIKFLKRDQNIKICNDIQW
jgi:hypothetical protein